MPKQITAGTKPAVRGHKIKEVEEIQGTTSRTESVQLERILKNLSPAQREAEKRIPHMLTDYQQRRAELGADPAWRHDAERLVL